MRSLLITVPLPSQVLSPNARPNRFRLASAKKRYRLDCGIAVLAAIRAAGLTGLPWRRATVRPTFFVATRGNRDVDNAGASLKSCFDSFQDAGLIVNDSGLVPLPVEFVVSADRRVELLVTEV